MSVVSATASRDASWRLFAFAALVSAVGVLLASLARIPWSLPSDTVHLNRASAEELAIALKVDLALTDRLVRWRERRGGFRSLQEALDAPLVVDSGELRELAERLKRIPSDRTNAEELAKALGTAPAVAARIVEERRMPGGPPADWRDDPVAALSISVLSPNTVAAVKDRLVVRTPGEAMGTMVLLLAAFVAALGLAMVLSRRLAPGFSDVFGLALIPTAPVFAVLAGMRDPLREQIIVGRGVVAVLAGVASLAAGLLLANRVRDRVRSANAAGRAEVPVAVLAGVWFLATLLLPRRDPPVLPGLAWLGLPLGMALLGHHLARKGAIDGPRTIGGLPVLPGRSPDRFTSLWPLWAPGVQAVVLWLAGGHAGVAAVAVTSVILAALGLGCRLRIVLLGALLGTVILGLIGLLAGSPVFALGRGDGSMEILWAITTSGFWGAGAGLGMTETLAGHSSRAFCSVLEELGWPGGILILAALAALVVRLARAGSRRDSALMRWYAIAAPAVLAAQALWACGGPIGLLPLQDVPLPLGLDSIVLAAMWLGILGWLAPLYDRTPIGQPVLHAQGVAGGRVLAVLAWLVMPLGFGVRLLWLQTAASERLAAAPIVISSCGEPVKIRNPRVLWAARRIQRGSIYDSDGRVLATSRFREISEALPGNDADARFFARLGRYYPYGVSCAGIVGVWDPQLGAQSGIEKELDADLRGYTNDRDLVRFYRTKDLPRWAGRLQLRGRDVVLSINARHQAAAYDILERYCKEVGPDVGGAIVVLHALQGHPIVAASRPSMDPDLFLRRRYSGMPAGPLPSAWTAEAPRPVPHGPVKLAVALALPPEAVSFTAVCRHTVGPVQWQDAGRRLELPAVSDHPSDPPHGRTDLAGAIAVSCNVYFAQLAAHVGPAKLLGRLNRLQPTVSWGSREEFASKMVGMVAGTETVRMSPLDVGILLVAASSRSAPVRPAYWFEVKGGGDGSRFVDPAVDPAQTLDSMAEAVSAVLKGLRQAATEGPVAGCFRDLRLPVAGRTGTVQGTAGEGREDAWFYGLAPADMPAYAVVCVIEGGQSGLRTAAPAAAELLRRIMESP